VAASPRLPADAAGAGIPIQQWFRVQWTPSGDGAMAVIKGTVSNGSPYRVSDVRLKVEGWDANQHAVGTRLAWAFGDIASGGETHFAVEALPGAVTYRIEVVSYDAVSLDSSP
jgi:hypothetical protein